MCCWSPANKGYKIPEWIYSGRDKIVLNFCNICRSLLIQSLYTLYYGGVSLHSQNYLLDMFSNRYNVLESERFLYFMCTHNSLQICENFQKWPYQIIFTDVDPWVIGDSRTASIVLSSKFFRPETLLSEVFSFCIA